MRLLILPLLVALIALGCSGPSLTERGDENLRRGNYEQAAAQYEAALREDPDDPELRHKYAEAVDLSVLANLEEARLATQEGAFDDAVFATEVALRWGPERADVKSWSTQFDRKLATEIHRRTVENAFERALDLGELASSHLPERYTMKARDEADLALATWRGWLVDEAEAASSEGMRATAALFYAEAARVTGEEHLEREAVRAVEEVRAANSVIFSVYSAGSRGGAVLDGVPERVGAARVVRGQLAEAQLAVEVLMAPIEIYDDTVRERRSKRYVAGHESRSNPEWSRLKGELRQLEQRERAAELDLRRARDARFSDRNDVTEANYDAARDRLDLIKRDVRDLEMELMKTDEFIREEVWAEHEWVVKTITRVAKTTLRVRLREEPSASFRETTEPIRLAETDTGQPGHRAAGVPEDPLQIPSVATMEASVLSVARERLVDLLHQNYDSHLNRAVARAEREKGATEAAALALVLNPKRPPAGAVERAVRLTGVRPEVVDHLARF